MGKIKKYIFILPTGGNFALKEHVLYSSSLGLWAFPPPSLDLPTTHGGYVYYIFPSIDY